MLAGEGQRATERLSFLLVTGDEVIWTSAGHDQPVQSVRRTHASVDHISPELPGDFVDEELEQSLDEIYGDPDDPDGVWMALDRIFKPSARWSPQDNLSTSRRRHFGPALRFHVEGHRTYGPAPRKVCVDRWSVDDLLSLLGPQATRPT